MSNGDGGHGAGQGIGGTSIKVASEQVDDTLTKQASRANPGTRERTNLGKAALLISHIADHNHNGLDWYPHTWADQKNPSEPLKVYRWKEAQWISEWRT